MAIVMLSLTAGLFAWAWRLNSLALKVDQELKAANEERAAHYIPPPTWLASNSGDQR
jgi:hypothetical protein